MALSRLLVFAVAWRAQALTASATRPARTRFEWDEAAKTSSLLALASEGPKLRSEAWLQNLVSIPQSRILKRVGSHVAATTAWAAAVLVADTVSAAKLPVVSATPLQVLGTAISLLLAFRTSQSYERYWAGRDVWCEVWASCRSLKRSILAYDDDDRLAVALCLVAIYPCVLVHYLRNELDDPGVAADLAETLETFARRVDADLDRDAALEWRDRLYAAPHLPLAVLDDLALLVRRVRNDALRAGEFDQGEFAVAAVETHLDRLGRALANAEKLLLTPVPPSYTRHTSRLLTLYALALPLSLANTEPTWIALPSVLLVSWALFALEEIGKIIEEPFGSDPEDLAIDLPIDKYAVLIANEVLSPTHPTLPAASSRPIAASTATPGPAAERVPSDRARWRQPGPGTPARDDRPATSTAFLGPGGGPRGPD